MKKIRRVLDKCYLWENKITHMKSTSILKTVKLNTEYGIILETLNLVKGNKSKAAKILGVDRKTIYNKIQRYKSHDNKNDH